MRRLRIRLSSPLSQYVAQALDAVAIWLCAVLAYSLYHGTPFFRGMPTRYEVLVAASVVTMFFFSSGIYRSWRFEQTRQMLRFVTLGWLATAACVVGWMFLSKSSSDYSRAWFIAWFVMTAFSLCAQRLVTDGVLRWFRRRGHNSKAVLLVKDGASGDFIETALAQSPGSGLRVLARVRPEELASLLNQMGAHQRVDEVWLCIRFGNEEGIRLCLDALKHSTANIRMVPDIFSLKLLNNGISEVLGVPMLDLSASPMTGRNLLIKTLLDYLVATTILIIGSPVMLTLALAVKLTSPGPAIFRQRRHGWNGHVIDIYKFRSMYVHSEEDGQVTQAGKGDSRLTPLGAFMRRSSLDELPQFINVLQGRMSVVGPRPHTVEHNELYKDLVPGYMRRHKVKPGITGWAQINGYRGETDTLDKMEKRVEYDLHYIENWSIWLDFEILIRTAVGGWLHRNAY